MEVDVIQYIQLPDKCIYSHILKHSHSGRAITRPWQKEYISLFQLHRLSHYTPLCIYTPGYYAWAKLLCGIKYAAWPTFEKSQQSKIWRLLMNTDKPQCCRLNIFWLRTTQGRKNRTLHTDIFSTVRKRLLCSHYLDLWVCAMSCSLSKAAETDECNSSQKPKHTIWLSLHEVKQHKQAATGQSQHNPMLKVAVGAGMIHRPPFNMKPCKAVRETLPRVRGSHFR